MQIKLICLNFFSIIHSTWLRKLSRNAGTGRKEKERRVSSSVSNGGSGNCRCTHFSNRFWEPRATTTHLCHRWTGQRRRQCPWFSVRATVHFFTTVNSSADQHEKIDDTFPVALLHSKAHKSNYHDCKDLLYFFSVILIVATKSPPRLIYFELSDSAAVQVLFTCLPKSSLAQLWRTDAYPKKQKFFHCRTLLGKYRKGWRQNVCHDDLGAMTNKRQQNKRSNKQITILVSPRSSETLIKRITKQDCIFSQVKNCSTLLEHSSKKRSSKW